MFAQFAHSTCRRKFVLVALLNVLLGGASAFLFAGQAIASDSPTIETFKESNAINSILCIAACNEFFEAGQANFEREIRNLQSRATLVEESPVLKIDLDLIKVLEEQREAESRQNF